MRPIAIVPRAGRELVVELQDGIVCLSKGGIDVRDAVEGEEFALIWIDDENVRDSLEALRNAGFQATVLTETDVPH
jgi:hypothetical protein